LIAADSICDDRECCVGSATQTLNASTCTASLYSLALTHYHCLYLSNDTCAQVDDLLQGANVYAPGKVLATTALNTGHFNFVPPSKREKLSFPALKVATNRPWLTAGSDHSGVFNQCCGLLVAWMEGVFRKKLSTDFGGLFGPGTWTDHQLLEATSTAGTSAATGSGAATSAAVVAAVTTTTVAAAVV
jgi:hypothetical protein